MMTRLKAILQHTIYNTEMHYNQNLKNVQATRKTRNNTKYKKKHNFHHINFSQ